MLRVVSLQLVNADTDEVIRPLVDGMVVSLGDTPRICVVAITENAGSVRFVVDDGSAHVESSAPFSYPGDVAGKDYKPWVLTVGSHLITATAYRQKYGKGKVSVPYTVGFIAVATGEPSPPPPPPPPGDNGGAGGKPSADNTGLSNPPALKEHRGLLRIDKPGVVENLDIVGRVEVRGSGVVTLRNCRIAIDVYKMDGIQNYLYDSDNNGKNVLIIENCEIYAVNDKLGWTTGIAGGTFRARGLYIHHVHDGLRPGDYSRFEGGYIHDLGYGGGGHSDGIQIVNDVWGVHVLRSFIDASFNTRAINGVNTDWIVDGNWLYGMSGTIGFKSGGKRVTVTNNKFGGPGRPTYNDPPAGTKWEGNTMEATGEQV